MKLAELLEQGRQLETLVELIGEDADQVEIKIYGEQGQIRKIVIEMSMQTITREIPANLH